MSARASLLDVDLRADRNDIGRYGIVQSIEKYAREGTNDYQEPLGEPRTISGEFHKYRSLVKLESFTNGEARGIPRGCHDLSRFYTLKVCGSTFRT